MKLEAYRTNNLYLAAYLWAKALEYAGIEGDEKKMFIFIDSPDREMFENQFNSKRNCQVDVWEFITALRVLKSQIHN